MTANGTKLAIIPHRHLSGCRGTLHSKPSLSMSDLAATAITPRKTVVTAATTGRTLCIRALHMCWEDLAFFHWPLDPVRVQPLLPPRLHLHTFEGQAWLGITPFRMTDVRPRWLPAVPGLSAFPELNVRTYVIADGIPGIWFFSLDAMQRVAVRIARGLINLPYHDAQISMTAVGNEIHWRSTRRLGLRRSPPTPGESPAEFVARYRPVGPVYCSQPGELDHWLTERYCLYTVTRSGQILRQAIDHEPWPLQLAAGEIELNTMPQVNGLPPIVEPPLMHFAKQLDVWGHLPEPVA